MLWKNLPPGTILVKEMGSWKRDLSLQSAGGVKAWERERVGKKAGPGWVCSPADRSKRDIGVCRGLPVV